MTLYELSARIRGRREDLGLSQADVAATAQVSRAWLNAFERGKSSVEMSPVLRVLDAIGLCLLVVECESRPSRLDAVVESFQ
ncbi:MAG: helix-turn-helix domain-containing protein [Acidimicrobiales bacterium]